MTAGTNRFVWFALALLPLCGEPAFARAVTFEERVAAQRAIEQVYWSHRIWPKENPGPKPPLDAIVPEEALRAQVEDYLRQSNALDAWWHRPITADQLQRELQRMANETKQPEVLKELFAALGNDPALIAETLVRPLLVRRLIEAWYSEDDRFHEEARRAAQEALARATGPESLRTLGGEYRETTWRRREVGAATLATTGGASPASESFALDAEAWDGKLAEVAGKFGAAPTSIPTGRVGALEETNDAFEATAVLAAKPDAITVATVSWPKRSFETWWSAERPAHSTGIDTLGSTIQPVQVAAARCADDSWRVTWGEVPQARYGHLAVWTGSEMIVWGARPGAGRYDPATDTWRIVSSGRHAPDPVDVASAVWTGTEMIIWGGGGPYTNRGGRYDPQTDTWQPTSTGPGCPSRRGYQTAVWTGTEMIVWGGWFMDPLDTGGRYDPSTDTWTPTSTGPGYPGPRFRHTAVWTGSAMLVWGGTPTSSNSPMLASGSSYDPATDEWTPIPMAGAPSARQLHTAVWTGSEMIVWGGSTDMGPPTNTGGRFRPSDSTWTPLPVDAATPSIRLEHTAVWTGSEMIVWGGHGGGSNLGSGGRFNPAANQWSTMSAVGLPNAARFAHTAVWTGTEMIVWGGMASGGMLRTGGRYLPASNSWVPTNSGSFVPTTPLGHTAVWTGSEMIVSSGAGSNTSARYSPATNQWSPIGAGAGLPQLRTGATAVWTGTEMIVWGGMIVSSPVPGGYTNTGTRYNPTLDVWAPTSTGPGLPAERLGHTAVWTGTEMVVWGGEQGATLFNSGGRYRPTTDSWIPTVVNADTPSARTRHSAVWTGSSMILFGGRGTGAADTGAQYDPATDSWTAILANPAAARQGHTAVWTGSEMIVWGGLFGEPLATGARYDPVSDQWTPTASGYGTPAGRQNHTAVWTGSEMIVWGGATAVAPYANSGGAYDPVGDTWTLTSELGEVPSARRTHTSVWSGSEMIVWGGEPFSEAGGLYCAVLGCAAAPSQCDDHDVCTADRCDAATDRCVHEVVVTCDDGNECTDDICQPDAGCVYTPIAEGFPCDDGSVCTFDDNCFSGTCLGFAILCDDDGDPCTVEACDPIAGCQSTPVTCDDGDVCTIDGCNPASGACDRTPVHCDDGDPCTTDSCDPSTGCRHDPGGDQDQDGVPDACDACPGSDRRPTVVVRNCNSKVPNDALPGGCTVADLIARCQANAADRRAYLQCVWTTLAELRAQGVITGVEAARILKCATRKKDHDSRPNDHASSRDDHSHQDHDSGNHDGRSDRRGRDDERSAPRGRNHGQRDRRPW